MGRFRVKTPINHDGQRAEPGSILELSAELAETLQRLDAIEPFQVPVAKTSARAGKAEG